MAGITRAGVLNNNNDFIIKDAQLDIHPIFPGVPYETYILSVLQVQYQIT